MASTTAPEFISDYERERGKPMPSLLHSAVQLRLGSLLMAKYEEQYSVFSELTLDFNPPLIPDLCVYPKMALDWSVDQVRVTDLPLLVIKIQSPTQSVQELVEKVQRYLAEGIQSAWLVEPMFKLIAVYAPGAEPQIYTQGEVTDPVTGISVTLEDIFQ